MPAPFELEGPGPRALVLLFLLVVVLPVVVTAAALVLSGGLARPPGPLALATVAGVSAVVFAVLATFAGKKELRVAPEGVTVRSSFYRIFVERSAIRTGEIRAADGQRDPACMLDMRTNGLSMPGFHSGWFRTRAAQKAFVAKAGDRCVLVPTTKGFVLILGTRDAEQASSALRASLS